MGGLIISLRFDSISNNETMSSDAGLVDGVFALGVRSKHLSISVMKLIGFMSFVHSLNWTPPELAIFSDRNSGTHASRLMVVISFSDEGMGAPL